MIAKSPASPPASPSAPGSRRRRVGNAAVELGGSVYTLGGQRAKDSLISEIYAFDTKSQKWNTIATHQPRTSQKSMSNRTGKRFVLHFRQKLVQFERRCCNVEEAGCATATARRSCLRLLSVLDAILFIGGQDGGMSVDTVELYNVTTNEWKTVSSMRHARRGLASAQIPGTSNVIVCGGDDEYQNTQDSCEMYDWQNDKWSRDLEMQPSAGLFWAFQHSSETVELFSS